MADKQRKIKFEDALKKLEKITEEIERGEIGLEESIERYEAGMKLVQQCRAILARAEQRIGQLSPTADGGLDVTNAPDSADDEAADET